MRRRFFVAVVIVHYLPDVVVAAHLSHGSSAWDVSSWLHWAPLVALDWGKHVARSHACEYSRFSKRFCVEALVPFGVYHNPVSPDRKEKEHPWLNVFSRSLWQKKGRCGLFVCAAVVVAVVLGLAGLVLGFAKAEWQSGRVAGRVVSGFVRVINR